MRLVTLLFLLAVCILLAQPCRADAIARRGADWIRITLRPCEDEAVIAAIRKRGLDPKVFWRAAAHVQGKDFAACWRQVGTSAHLVYSDGDEGVLTAHDLVPLREV